MITFLNDKYDWHLRGSFFDNIVGVAAYIGWQSSTILKPLMQQVRQLLLFIELLQKSSSAAKTLLIITLELRMILQNI